MNKLLIGDTTRVYHWKHYYRPYYWRSPYYGYYPYPYRDNCYPSVHGSIFSFDFDYPQTLGFGSKILLAAE